MAYFGNFGILTERITNKRLIIHKTSIFNQFRK